ncbi:MAG: hypothetical protein V5788_02145 [Shewanella sp.]
MRHSGRLKHIKHVHRSAHIRRMRYFTSQNTTNYIPANLEVQSPEKDVLTGLEESTELKGMTLPANKTA